VARVESFQEWSQKGSSVGRALSGGAEESLSVVSMWGAGEETR
jgi:hypothetical protein